MLSDDEDEDMVKRELSPSTYRHSLDSVPPSARSQSHAVEEIIDLTLSDDDEPPPPPPPTLKRKAPEMDLPAIETWKKLRPDAQEHLPPPPPALQSQPRQQSQAQQPLPPIYRSPPSSNLDIRSHGYDQRVAPAPPPPTLPPLNGYSQQPQVPPPYLNFPGRTGLTESRQLPPPSLPGNSYHGRVNPPTRWPGQ